MVERDETVPESWRVVVFTNMPGGFIYSLVADAIRPLGHRVVGVVTTPGPKRRRGATYLDVIVSNHPPYWAERGR